MNRNQLQAIDRAICGEVWASDAVARHLEMLCLDCGGRFAGSENYRQAVEVMTRLWQDYGLVDVHTEPFPMTAWQRGSASLEMLQPASRIYPCIALPYAPSCDMEAELIDLGYGLSPDFEAAGDAVRGKIALVMNGAPPGAGRAPHRMEKYMQAKSAGAAAFIFMDNEPGMLSPTGSLAYDERGPLDQALPSIGIAYEVGMDLRQWGRRGPVKARLHLENNLSKSTSWNVVGDIPGRDAGDGRMLLFGAHLDGHDIAQGAIDNASGVAGITEAARVLVKQKEHLPRTVRFICFGVEELGLLGSYAYARAHPELMDSIQFVFNMDVVGGDGTLALVFQNCSELVPHFKQLTEPLATACDLHEMLIPFSDHFPFTLKGVPAAFIASGPGQPGKRGWGHTAADTLEKVNVQNVRSAAALTARLAVRLANETLPWPGRRRSPDEVKAVLEAQGVDKLLRMEGAWPF